MTEQMHKRAIYIYRKQLLLLAHLLEISIYAFSFYIVIRKQAFLASLCKCEVKYHDLVAPAVAPDRPPAQTPIFCPPISTHFCRRANIKLPGIIYKLLCNKEYISCFIYNKPIISPGRDYAAQIPARHPAEGPRP